MLTLLGLAAAAFADPADTGVLLAFGAVNFVAAAAEAAEIAVSTALAEEEAKCASTMSAMEPATAFSTACRVSGVGSTSTGAAGVAGVAGAAGAAGASDFGHKSGRTCSRRSVVSVAEYSGEQLESAAIHFNSAHFAAVLFAAAHLNGAVHSTSAHFVAVLFLIFRVSQSCAAELSSEAGSVHLTSFQSEALYFDCLARVLPLLTGMLTALPRLSAMASLRGRSRRKPGTRHTRQLNCTMVRLVWFA